MEPLKLITLLFVNKKQRNYANIYYFRVKAEYFGKGERIWGTTIVTETAGTVVMTVAEMVRL